MPCGWLERKFLLVFPLVCGLACQGIAGNREYKDDQQGFQLTYPKKLILEGTKSKVRLFHSIRWRHPNPCAFSDDDVPDIDLLTDFILDLEVVSGPLGRVVGDLLSYDPHIEYAGDLPKERGEGWFEDFQVRSLKGYLVQQGVEGCGAWKYLFPLKDGRILIVTRGMITELSGISGLKNDALKVPGVITPEEEERMFREILASFKLMAKR